MTKVLRLQHTSVPMPPGGHDKARTFYGGALNMREIPPPSTLDTSRLVWFAAGDDGHEVHCFLDETMDNKSAAQHLCLQVDDIDAYRARMVEYGVAVEETETIRNRPRFFVHDPFNNFIEIAQITGDYA